MAALGVAAFGPLDIDPSSSTYGTLLDTPKLDWQRVDLRAALGGIAPLQVFQIDVYSSARAELEWGAFADGGRRERLAYITVGTGIGASLAVAGQGLPRQHAEFGHIFVPRHPSDTFPGSCPYHGDCLEGLASAPALQARWGRDAQLVIDPQAWEMQAHYLAHACLTILRVWAPQQLVLAGGVAQHEGLLHRVRERLNELLGGYHQGAVEELVVSPALGMDSGLWGALLLAEETATAVESA